jgi:hypothetical protein
METASLVQAGRIASAKLLPDSTMMQKKRLISPEISLFIAMGPFVSEVRTIFATPEEIYPCSKRPRNSTPTSMLRFFKGRPLDTWSLNPFSSTGVI